MASRLPKSPRIALSLTVAVTAMALGGSAYAQNVRQMGDGKVIVRCEGPTDNCLDPAGGSLRNEAESDTTDQSAAGQPATDEAPTASAPSADEPPADADEDTATDEPEPE